MEYKVVRANLMMQKAWEEVFEIEFHDPNSDEMKKLIFALGYAAGVLDTEYKITTGDNNGVV